MEIRKDHVSNTGDLYGVMALDEDWVTLNQMIKYYKFGLGRVTDYLNFEIRSALYSGGVMVLSPIINPALTSKFFNIRYI